MLSLFMDWMDSPSKQNSATGPMISQSQFNEIDLNVFMEHAKPNQFIYLNDYLPSSTNSAKNTDKMTSTGRFFVLLPKSDNPRVLVLWKLGVITIQENQGGFKKHYFQFMRDFTSHLHNHLKFPRNENIPIELRGNKAILSRIENILNIPNGKLEHFTMSVDSMKHTPENYQASDAILFRQLLQNRMLDEKSKEVHVIYKPFANEMTATLTKGMLQKSLNEEELISPSTRNDMGFAITAPTFDPEKMFWQNSTKDTGNGPMFENGSKWNTSPDSIKKIITKEIIYDKKSRKTYLTWVNENTRRLTNDCFLLTTYSPSDNFNKNSIDKWGFHIILDHITSWGVFGAERPKDALDEILENKHSGYMPLYRLIGEIEKESKDKLQKNDIQRSCIYGVRELDVIHILLSLQSQENSTIHYSVVTPTGNPNLHFLYFSATETIDEIKTTVVMRAECRDGKPNLKRKDMVMIVKDKENVAQHKLTDIAQLQGYMAIGNSDYDRRAKAYGGIPESWTFQANGLVMRHLMRYTISDTFTTTLKRVPGSADDDLRAAQPYVSDSKKFNYITSKDFKHLMNVYAGESQGDLRNRIRLAKKTSTA
jgi:hypothetical protein